MPTTVDVTLRVITPLFTGGVDFNDGKGPVRELRTQSVKGLLAYWYRALHPDRSRDEEYRIFGATGSDEIGGSSSKTTGGRAGFRLSIAEPTDGKIRWSEPGEKDWGQRLAYPGYPFRYRRGKLVVDRYWIAPESKFVLTFRFGPRARAGDIDAVMGAVWALSTFGGLGSRSRRGWGAIAIENVSLDGYEKIVHADVSTVDELCDRIRTNLEKFGEPARTRPEYTAFSTETRSLIMPAQEGAHGSHLDNALSAIGAGGELLRQWRHDKSRFGNDSRAVHNYLDKNKKPSVPQRLIFGAPHNYFYPHRMRQQTRPFGARIDAVLGMSGSDLGRRASPLLMTVVPVGHNLLPMFTFMKAKFLPNSAKIRFTPQQGKGTIFNDVEFTEDYSPITDFLDDLGVNQGWTELRLFSPRSGTTGDPNERGGAVPFSQDQ